MEKKLTKQRLVGLAASKIAFLDIETAPLLGWVWGKWEQNVIEFEKDGYILCFSYKFLGDSKVHTVSLPDFPNYKKDKEDDRELIKELVKVLDSAEIIVAHNGDRFDFPRINTRILYHKLKPPTPFKTIDTLKIARNKFGFVSNKLDDISQYLGLGRKLAHKGFHLWKQCMSGDMSGWKDMEAYNAQDVLLLEKVYLKFRPWYAAHPNVNILSGKTGCCPVCGSLKLQRRGYRTTRTSKFQRFQCFSCGAWASGKSEKVELQIK